MNAEIPPDRIWSMDDELGRRWLTEDPGLAPEYILASAVEARVAAAVEAERYRCVKIVVECISACRVATVDETFPTIALRRIDPNWERAYGADKPCP